MGELSDALRADGRHEIAAALEHKELAGRLRQAGREDLADALITGEQTPPPEQPEPAPEPEAEHERLARQLADAQSEWITLGKGTSDGEAA